MKKSHVKFHKSEPNVEQVAIEPQDPNKPQAGKQGRVRDPSRDRRLAVNRSGPTGQGARRRNNDKRLASVRGKPTGQGYVKNPLKDKRLAANRNGPSGQGRVKNPLTDKRLSENKGK